MLYLPDDRRLLLERARPDLSLSRQCELLCVSRSSFYYVPTAKEMSKEKESLLKLIDEVYTLYPFFGTRQMSSYLKQNGRADIERHHARWAYGQLGLQSVAPGPHTSKPHPEHKIYPYLLRDMKIKGINKVWSTDITYIRLQKGFVYLMAIIDWSLSHLPWFLTEQHDAEMSL
jgi:putative transposase